jgi:hypothetical protein
MSGDKRAYSRRINPANLADLPTVLNTQQVSDVTIMSLERVRRAANAGELRRLDYSTDFLFHSEEVARYLREHTKSMPAARPGDE